MKFLLDTNAVSEPLYPRPDAGYMSWIMIQSDADLAVSALTMGELHRGARRLAAGAKRSRIEAWISDAVFQFQDRILDVDMPVASAWADLTIRHERAGKVVGAVDELLAATALVHDLTLVTRNTRHFTDAGCKLLSPWSG